MIKPALIPSFATDPTLTGGPQVGLASRLQPSSAYLAQGQYQDRRMPARVLGWLLGTIGDWLGYLAPVQIKNWQIICSDTSFFGTGMANVGLLHIPEAVGTHWMPWGFGSLGYTYHFPQMAAPWQIPTVGGHPGFTATWNDTASNSDGSVLVACGSMLAGPNTPIYRSTDRGATWTSITAITGTFTLINSVVWEPVSGLFCLFPIAGTNVYTSPDGVTWTARAYGATPAQASGVGGGFILAADTIPRYSSNGGVSWTAGPAFPAGIGGAGEAAWLPGVGFTMLGTAAIASLMPGSAWSATSSPFGANKAVSIASDGISRLAIAHNDSTASPGHGVHYSDDGGVAWNKVRLSTIAGEIAHAPKKIRYGGGQWAMLGGESSGAPTFALWSTLQL